jgi:hypothetical protein
VHLLIKEIALFMGLLIVQLESRRLKVISCFESQTYIIFRQCVHDSTLWIFFFSSVHFNSLLLLSQVKILQGLSATGTKSCARLQSRVRALHLTLSIPGSWPLITPTRAYRRTEACFVCCIYAHTHTFHKRGTTRAMYGVSSVKINGISASIDPAKHFFVCS